MGWATLTLYVWHCLAPAPPRPFPKVPASLSGPRIPRCVHTSQSMPAHAHWSSLSPPLHPQHLVPLFLWFFPWGLGAAGSWNVFVFLPVPGLWCCGSLGSGPSVGQTEQKGYSGLMCQLVWGCQAGWKALLLLWAGIELLRDFARGIPVFSRTGPVVLSVLASVPVERPVCAGSPLPSRAVRLREARRLCSDLLLCFSCSGAEGAVAVRDGEECADARGRRRQSCRCGYAAFPLCLRPSSLPGVPAGEPLAGLRRDPVKALIERAGGKRMPFAVEEKHSLCTVRQHGSWGVSRVLLCRMKLWYPRLGFPGGPHGPPLAVLRG